MANLRATVHDVHMQSMATHEENKRSTVQPSAIGHSDVALSWISILRRCFWRQVSGSKGPAEQGTLIFLAAGDEALFKEATPGLEAMGKKSV